MLVKVDRITKILMDTVRGIQCMKKSNCAMKGEDNEQ